MLASLFSTGCSIFGIRTSEEAPFTLLIDSGDIQIRQYQDLLVSETIIEATMPIAARSALIAFGNITKQQKMATPTTGVAVFGVVK
ncbi:MAG: hypothetical protein PHC94_13865 [Methylobacter sp.]|nr:hypothetical protein [Methylococcales bacterium]MDD5115098.1 hypothetical protein [Methylobacter sp.]